MHVMRGDMQIVGLRKEDAEDRKKWKMMICYGDSYKKLGKAKGGRRLLSDPCWFCMCAVINKEIMERARLGVKVESITKLVWCCT